MSAIPETFQGYVYENFGDPLTEVKLKQLPQPELKPSHVCIKVHAAALNPADSKIVQYGSMLPFITSTPSVEKPFRFGCDVSGVVVAVGRDVKHLNVGDAVFGCAFFGDTGSCAEYVGMDAVGIALKPKCLSFAQAAGVPIACSTSYLALLNQIQKGDRVLVLGGSSATGLFGIQLAKLMGASYVITTTSKRNTELVKSVGADETIDYTATKWVDNLEAHSIDLIYTCVDPNTWNDEAQRVLKKDTGRYISIIPPNEPQIESAIGAEKTFVIGKEDNNFLGPITELIETGKLVVPIDSIHPFEKLHDALKVQLTNHARGKVIIQVVREVSAP